MPIPTNLLTSHPVRKDPSTREARRWRCLKADPTLHRLISDLLAARVRAGLAQGQVALRMRTTKSAISRLKAMRS
jgi:hypothetical protein